VRKTHIDKRGAAVCNISPTFPGQHFRLLIVLPQSSILETSNALATSDCRQVLVLEVTCRQHWSGRPMCPIVSTFASRITAGFAFVTDDIAKMLKMQRVFSYNGIL